jgi:hypothetical protein
MQTHDEMQETINDLQKKYDSMSFFYNQVCGDHRRLEQQVEELNKQIENSIGKDEHERIIAQIRQEYEEKLSGMKPRVHNERNGGRKKVASKEVVDRAMELRGQKLSQIKIAEILSEEYGIVIKRTTVGDIVRGEYTPSDAE